jgi:hypothetical protein
MRFTKYYKSDVMKRVVVLTLSLVIFSSMAVLAQNPNLERLNAYKIAFITRKLNLTSAEAERFWPAYNEYQDKKLLIQQNRAEINRSINQNSNALSEKELTDLGDKWVSLDVEESALLKDFHNKLKTILPPAKIVRLYQAENQYRQQLLNELQNRRQGNINNPAPPVNRPLRN